MLGRPDSVGTRPATSSRCLAPVGASMRALRRQASAMRAVGLFAAAALSLLAAGCGGGGPSNGVASLTSGSSTTNPVPAANAGGSSAPSSTRLESFSTCMRAHGEPSFPDPVNGQLRLAVTKGGPLDPNSPQFQSALEDCKSLAPSGLAGASTSSTGSLSQVLKFAHCMRAHGVTNFPDPTKNGGFLMSGSIQDNPHFQSALQACRTLLPGGAGTAP